MMTPIELFNTIREAATTAEVDEALAEFQRTNHAHWVPVGRENNRGTIEVASDPARSNIERITNGIDAILEYEHDRHGGLPLCRSPKEAASAWLAVPDNGLSAMTAAQRRALGQRLTVTLDVGDGRSGRILDVRDKGIGIAPASMPNTILSLNESNKLSKHYVVGAYGQGGSSTFAFSRISFIASRSETSTVGFTLVRFMDLPAEQFKTGHYVYLVTDDGQMLTADVSADDFPRGTQVRHYGYDLNSYPSPFGPSSLYGSMNTILFDPVMPIWFDNRVRSYRRVIKGSRNALNGAVDEGDEGNGPSLAHSMPMFSVSLGDFGMIGIEYWVLQSPTSGNKRPSASYVNPTKPIILSLNGQNQGEFSHLLIRKDAELPFLVSRLIAHIDCNNLSAASKRLLFVSNREMQRDVKVRDMIRDEIVKALRSDDNLKHLNEEARHQGMQEQDEDALRHMRNEVARLLRLQGLDLGAPAGGVPGERRVDSARPVHPRPPHLPLAPIELHEPPTYIRIVSDEAREITFYAEQRRYIRVETDANSIYHDSNNPSRSNINLIVGDDLAVCGSTPLRSGRMRLIVEGAKAARIGSAGVLRVELRRTGLPVLVDERRYRIVAQPEALPTGRNISFPPFKTVPVEGPDDQKWIDLDWPDDPRIIASEALMEEGTLTIYYSTMFPKFHAQRAAFERRDAALGASFTRRYEIWLAVHALLKQQDEQITPSERATEVQGEAGTSVEQIESTREREERCRIAVMSSMFATREVQMEGSNLMEQAALLE